MTIGEKIKELRTRYNMTQEKLAEYLNVTVPPISQWESGKTSPDISQIAPLCNIFGVSSDSLLGISAGQNKTVLEQTKNEVFALANCGNYSAAFAAIKRKINEYPNDVRFKVIFAELVMAYFNNSDGSAGSKNSIFEELYEMMITQNNLDKFRNEYPAESELEMNILMFIIHKKLAQNSDNKAEMLSRQISELIDKNALNAARNIIIEELQNYADNDRNARIACYKSAAKLLAADIKSYDDTKNTDVLLLQKIIGYGEFIIDNNVDIITLIKAMKLLQSAYEKMTDIQNAKKYAAILQAAQEELL